MPSAVVLSHRDIAHELGHLGEWLSNNGYEVERRFREDSPTVPESDVLIALGSPGSVALGYCAPAGEEEISAIQNWLGSGRPFLGICYGAQALTCALGGTVERMSSTDRGWMTLASDESDHAALVGPWLVWHEDALRAPASATVRARSGNADQVFSQGRAWGIQFHPELTSGLLDEMASGLGAPDEDYLPLVAAMAQDEEGHRTRAHRLFDAWAADVALA